MKCDLGDLAIFYETYGTGRPLVMLPGRPSDHHIMERFMEPLFTQRDGWLRIYPDLPGTGLTPSVDRLATHEAMLDAVLAFIDTIIPGQRFVLAGLSYGGYLARGVVSRRGAEPYGGRGGTRRVGGGPESRPPLQRATGGGRPRFLRSGYTAYPLWWPHAHTDRTTRSPLWIPGRLGSAGQLPQSDLRGARSGRTFCEYRTG